MRNNKPQVINKHVTLLNCLTVSIPVSIFLSSLLTAVIATFIVYLIMRKRSYNIDAPFISTTQLDPIYDDVKLISLINDCLIFF